MNNKGLWSILTILLSSFSVLVECDQVLINYLAENLDIGYNVINNLGSGGTHYDLELVFTNSGSEPIPDGTVLWQLYFCNIRLIEPDIIRNGGADLGQSGLRIYHVAGCLHMIEPAAEFAGIPAGQTIRASTIARDWSISKTDAMPNWYITDADSEPRTIESTAGESLNFVGPFDGPEKWKRTDDDTYNPYSGEDRYNRRDYSDKGSAQSWVIPTPRQVSYNSDQEIYIVPQDWVVVDLSGQLAFEAEFLAENLGTTVVEPDLIPSTHYLSLNIVESPSGETEYYRLVNDERSSTVEIQGSDSAGVFYGIQSLLSLAYPDNTVPGVEVTDYPRFSYRGMHVDVGRHFRSKEKIIQLIDLMVMYKLNKLYFHITDDEGWRLEIEGLPELTEVGASQCHDPSRDQCIEPQLGSGHSVNNEGTGHYTTADYQEMLAYAAERHVQVIPEFDMPGHAHAAIQAMLARYRRYMEEGDEEAATEYLLSDPDDNSEYFSAQFFTENAINPCLDSTYNFIQHLIREVKAMHAGIQDLTVFNFGGDEVPDGAWINSTACWELGLTTQDEIKAVFIRQVANISANEGLNLAGWEDGYNQNATHIYGRDVFPNDQVYSYTWDNVWEWGGGEMAHVFANREFGVILSHATHLYFDHPYEPDPEERGYYWATRVSDTRKTFGYMPDSIYDNIDLDRMGNPLTKDDVCSMPGVGCEELEEDKRQYIIGIQGQIWCETVRRDEQLDYMITPPLLALAERAWHKAAWEDTTDTQQRDAERTQDFENFANTLGYKELHRLDDMGVLYAVSPPGVRITSENLLETRAEFPGLPVQYSYDNVTWYDFQTNTIVDEREMYVITRSADRARISRSSSATGNVLSSGNQLNLSKFTITLALLMAISLLSSLV